MPYVFNPFTNSFDWTAPGVTDHSALLNLDYASSGHTGFQSALTFPLAPNLGGTGIANAVGSTLTLGAATSITGGGTINAGGFTFSIPATGTAALLGTANVFTANQKINVNSTTALLVEQDGVNDNVFTVDTNTNIGIVDIGGFGAKVAITTDASNQPRFFVSSSVNAVSGIQMYNSSIGVNADFRFIVADTDKLQYVAFATPGKNNNLTWFGLDRKVTNAIINNTLAGGVGRTLVIGTITAENIVFGTTNLERMRINSDGGILVTGGADRIQTIIKAHSTQTANILEVQNSAAGVLAKITPTGGALFSDKVQFTQTDGNEYIDSLNDGYMDYRATTAHRFGDGTNQTNIAADGTISFAGTAGIVIPHIMQSDSTNQAIADIAAAQVVTFDTDVYHAGITRTSSSRFTITKAGSYLIAFSGVCVGAAGQTIQVWLRQSTGGGAAADVANSNTIYPFKTTGTNGLVAVTFINHFEVNDYFEFWTWGSAVTSTWTATAAGSSPTRPACPSIIMTANYVGED